ncbi:MAG TPA: crosslink repair DNA glycosylase YcaQ family protein, partial [Rubrobacteraceae bacterium]
MIFSRGDARVLLLAAQGLNPRLERPVGKADVLEAVRRMAVLQIDSISVVARSPYLVLWSRLGPYEPRWLDELLAEGKLFEYWSHAACFLPIEDYSLYRRLMLEGREKTRSWFEAHPQEVKRVLAQVRERGAVRSAE